VTDSYVRVVGDYQLSKVARDLKAAGDRELRKAMLKAARDATNTVKPEMHKAALSDLPKRGGLNAWMESGMKVTTRTITRVRGTESTITIRRPNPRAKSGQADVSAINRGRLRHPVFGHGPWVIDVRGKPVKQWADRVLDGPVARKARREFLAALDDLAGTITR
jgi:hypothetical protein